ncbi:MAG: UDP-glucose/GDP-mannose dehydrogenase family protein, partial [bacterium]|nr:UDP-glucose/GDP-mannose dehydrogenase family protein [bacterium]
EFSDSIKYATEKSEIIFICVNTPPKPTGEADLIYVEEVSKEIARNLSKFTLIVEKSTVPVETCERIKQVFEIYGKKGLYEIASNPEFLREGSAVYDFFNPDRIVIGVESKKAEKMLKNLYKKIKTTFVITDTKSAELIKHASNSFLALKISYANMLSRICDIVNADIKMVTYAMGLDKRISSEFLKAGIGFGGSCFPKDLMAFNFITKKLGLNFKIIEDTLEINNTQVDYFINKIKNKLWNLNRKKIAVWGLSFKPETDDVRNSQAIEFIKKIISEGAQVVAYDPKAIENAKKVLKESILYAKDKYTAVENAECLCLLTEWKEFINADFKKVKQLLQAPFIFDGRNVLNYKYLKKLGFYYEGIGIRCTS